MANYGKHRYVGDEGTNIVLGQLGIKVVSPNADSGAGEWVAIKAVDGAAEAYWDALTGDSVDSGNSLTLADGDIVYGTFSKVYCEAGSTGTLLVYYG